MIITQNLKSSLKNTQRCICRSFKWKLIEFWHWSWTAGSSFKHLLLCTTALQDVIKLERGISRILLILYFILPLASWNVEGSCGYVHATICKGFVFLSICVLQFFGWRMCAILIKWPKPLNSLFLFVLYAWCSSYDLSYIVIS